jgi:hypothetical protein
LTQEWNICTLLLDRLASSLFALGVVVVDLVASQVRGTALGTREADATALRVDSSAASSRGSRSRGSGGSGLSNGGKGGRGRDLLVGLSGAAATGTAGPDSRAGHGESLVSVVDAEVGVGVGGLVSTRELDHGAGLAATATLDLDLHAGDVVLGLVDVGAVNTNVLSAHKVLAVRRVLGDLGGDVVTVPGAPAGVLEVTSAETLLEDLEPVARTVVGRNASGGLGHVDQGGTGVLEFGSDSKLEFDLVTGVDGHDLSVTGLRATLVADDIGAIGGGSIADIGLRVGGKLDGVVLGLAARLANVLEGRLRGAVDNVGVEEVMGGRHLGDGGDDKSRDLHSDRAVMIVVEEVKRV